jgi:hypothetical protein
MIVESIVLGLTVITCSSLWLSDRVHKRESELDVDPKSVRAAIAEKRRVLERDRAEWARMFRTSAFAVKRAADIDRRLLALADEESRIPLE